ncbi:hypothetical protein [Microbacterium istanbulense]|uniref:Uncharacterized protein n=1 Tax=Microbacterium istanbulense TaxID=3122049 RepID=A0ABU8LMI9_9MICO
MTTINTPTADDAVQARLLAGRSAYGGERREVRTTEIRTLDDLHESNLRELVQYAANNPAAVPGVFVGGGFSADKLADRRRAVQRFNAVTAPRLHEAVDTVNRTPWFLMWLPRARRAVRDLLVFTTATLQKVEFEDEFAGLEQFGPIKRAVNEAFRD